MISASWVSIAACSDVELVRIIRNHGAFAPAAQEQLAAIYKPRITAAVGQFARTYDTSVQDEAWAAALRALFHAVCGFNFDAGTTFATYASSCIDNAVKQTLKAEGVHRRRNVALNVILPDNLSLEDHVITTLTAPARAAARNAAATATRAFVDELPAKQQHIVRRIFWQGWSQADVARELGISRSAVNSTLKRVYRHGRVALKPFNPTLLDS